MKRIILFLILTGLCAIAEAEVKQVKIDPGKKFQTLQGYGQGNMEQTTPVWYKRYGKAGVEKIADTLYTLKNDGLGLNICRYPMPAADDPNHNHMRRLPKMANKPFEYEDGKFNWDGHEDVLWLGKGAADRGAIMWASWYGIPYWLSTSGCAAGSKDGKSNNLIAGKEKRFIKHVMDVLIHFRDQWGIEFDYVAPINEPEADWWKAGGGQPGSHVSAEQAVILYRELYDSLKKQKYDAKLIAYDAAYTNTTEYLKELLKTDLKDKLDVFGCHQYITEIASMQEWAAIAKKHKKPLWMTEWGDWVNVKKNNANQTKQMMLYANKLHESFEILQSNAWIMWEAGFIFNAEEGGLEKRKSYWAIAHYSRHVRPGFTRVEAIYKGDDCKTTAWTKKEEGKAKLVIVSVNATDSLCDVEYDLSQLAKKNSLLQIRQSSSEKNYELSGKNESSGNILKVTLPKYSVTTVEIEY
ncbi:MAG: hypothetical protein JEZ07_18220 [Phycisphaerae bacterium]|nr:hypothetical protein [Phycisphaerae bacterium]